MNRRDKNPPVSQRVICPKFTFERCDSLVGRNGTGACSHLASWRRHEHMRRLVRVVDDHTLRPELGLVRQRQRDGLGQLVLGDGDRHERVLLVPLERDAGREVRRRRAERQLVVARRLVRVREVRELLVDVRRVERDVVEGHVDLHDRHGQRVRRERVLDELDELREGDDVGVLEQALDESE